MLLMSLLALAVAQTPVELAVLPARGSAAISARAETTREVITVLRSLEDVRVISLERISDVLGPEAERVFDGCKDDTCLREVTRSVRASYLLATSLDQERDALVLRLQLIPTSSASRLPAGRVTTTVREDAGGLAAAVTSAVTEIFPEAAARSFGTLRVSGGANARLAIDGAEVPNAEGEGPRLFRLRAGPHTVRALRPGHEPFEVSFDVRVGRETEVAMTLEKRRSQAPYVVGGVGVVAGGLGLLFGALAGNIAGNWDEGCASGTCAAGFTRQRYLDDRADVDRLRISANVLFLVSAAAAIAGVTWYALDPGVEELP